MVQQLAHRDEWHGAILEVKGAAFAGPGNAVTGLKLPIDSSRPTLEWACFTPHLRASAGASLRTLPPQAPSSA
jgi:hypothetical protein